MARAKTGVVRRRKHNKVLKAAKGYRMTRHRLVKQAKSAVLHSGNYAFDGRKKRKQDFRTLWIQRINGGLSSIDGAPSYSRFIKMLSDKKIELDRKIMADLAANQPEVFQALVRQVSQ